MSNKDLAVVYSTANIFNKLIGGKLGLFQKIKTKELFILVWKENKQH